MPAASGFIPERGDLVWIDFSPQAGHEQSGRRPAVVLSPGIYNGKVGLAVFCPLTRQAKGYRFEVPIPAGLPVSGVVLSDQIRSLDWRARKAEPIGHLPSAVIEQILARSRTLL